MGRFTDIGSQKGGIFQKKANSGGIFGTQSKVSLAQCNSEHPQIEKLPATWRTQVRRAQVVSIYIHDMDTAIPAIKLLAVVQFHFFGIYNKVMNHDSEA